MRYIKLFEAFGLDDLEDFLVEFMDRGDCFTSFKNDHMGIYTFRNQDSFNSTKKVLESKKISYYSAYYSPNDVIVLLSSELERFMNSKFLDCQKFRSKKHKEIIIWKKGDEVVANLQHDDGLTYFWAAFEIYSSLRYEPFNLGLKPFEILINSFLRKMDSHISWSPQTTTDPNKFESTWWCTE